MAKRGHVHTSRKETRPKKKGTFDKPVSGLGYLRAAKPSDQKPQPVFYQVDLTCADETEAVKQKEELSRQQVNNVPKANTFDK